MRNFYYNKYQYNLGGINYNNYCCCSFIGNVTVQKVEWEPFTEGPIFTISRVADKKRRYVSVSKD